MTWHDEIVRSQAILQPLLWRVPFALLILLAGVLLAFFARSVIRLVVRLAIDRGADPVKVRLAPPIAWLAVVIATVSLSLLALGVAGTVIGFAVSLSVALGLVADSSGGLRILLNKPFSIGDTVELKGDGLIGLVEQISLLGTVLLALPERSRVFIPNRQFFEHPIVNHSSPEARKTALFQFVLEPPPTMESLEELLQLMLKDAGLSGNVFVTSIEAATVTLKITLETTPWLKDQTASAFLRHAESELKTREIRIHSLTLRKD